MMDGFWDFPTPRWASEPPYAPPPLVCEKPLYSWETEGDPHCWRGGVSFDRPTALGKLADALRDTDATSGTVKACHLHPVNDTEYVYGPVIARGTFDEETGAVVWSARP